MDKVFTDFWNPKNLEHAKALIIGAPDWDDSGKHIMPILLNEVIRGRLPNLNSRTALEIGCGIGRLMRQMSKEFSKVIGIDIAPNMIALSKTFLEPCPNTVTSLTDGTTIPAESDSIDFIYSVIVFQHFPDRATVQKNIEEIKRVLIPGGVARIQTHMGIPTKTWTGTMVGYFYPSLDAFASEFRRVGLAIEQAEHGLWHPSHLWITAVKASS